MENKKEKNIYMLSIDNGLSVGKATLIDVYGNIAGVSSFKNEVINNGYASEVDIRIVQIAGYDVVAGEKSTELSRETFGINLRKIINLAASLGVMLALENVDSESGDSLEKIVPYIKDINSPWLQIYPDFGNLTAMNQNAERQLRAYACHIPAIHVKDTLEGVVRNIPFGEGKVDFVSVFKVLKNVGFNGPFLLELWADDKKDNLATIRNSREWVVEKLRQASYFMPGDYSLITQ
jgi:L-ribulose-5-phosphate 3-epimerase